MAAGKDASFNRVHYALRPQKQIERRLIIECLHKLMLAGYPISDYTYLGLGSFYYADFILFHKYAHIRRMICAERRPIPKRMRFNKPYSFIQLEMNPVGSVIPTLKRRNRHLVWLDYDGTLLDCGLGDLGSLLGILPAGSVFLVTVNAHSREPDDPEPGTAEDEARREKLYNAYKEQFGRYYSGEMRKAIVSKRELPAFLADVIRGFVSETLLPRDPTKIGFQQLFNYKYADGAQMLTYGGIMDSPEGLSRLVSGAQLKAPFALAPDPVEISVPPLTHREQHWLDQHLLSIKRSPETIRFELSREAVLNYAAYYREYPAYYESLV